MDAAEWPNCHRHSVGIEPTMTINDRTSGRRLDDSVLRDSMPEASD
jgi:hypothetical protein